jgi:hypothetical protein
MLGGVGVTGGSASLLFPVRASSARLVRLVALLSLAVLSSAFASSFTQYSVEVQNVQQQTDSSTIISGYPTLAFDQYALVAKIDTLGLSLSAAPILTLPTLTSPAYPSGMITFATGPGFSPPYPGANGLRYDFANAWNTTAELANNVGSGTFTFTLGDATAMPTLSLDTASPFLPTTPEVISGGTWSGGTLLIDPNVTTTLDLNSSAFTTYTTGPSGLGGAITVNLFAAGDYPTPLTAQLVSQYVPSLGKTDPALSSITLPAGTLVPGQNYILQTNYAQLLQTNTTSFTGTGITGSPLGLAYDTSSTFINIQAVPEPSTWLDGFLTAGWLCVSFADARKHRRRLYQSA